jgi:putative ABC transport system permease protein
VKNLFEAIWQDARYAFRIFAKTPIITMVAVLSLALGIGANTAIFSLIDTVMLRLLPVQKPEELQQVLARSPHGGQPSGGFTNPLWEQVRDQQDVFSGVFGWSGAQFDLAQGGEAHYAEGLYASGDYFRTLGVRPAAGRLLTVDDDKRGCAGAAVLSYGFWQEHYGGAPGAVGQLITLDGFAFQVVGVAAPGFFGVEVGQHFDVAVPICTEAIFHGKNSMLDRRSAWWIRVMGRPKPGLTAQQVSARLQVLSPQILAAATPQNWKPDEQQNFVKRTLVTQPGATGLSYVRRQYESPLKVLMGVVGLVLLIACANIASLMLARSAARRKEIAVRLAVGASRWRLIRQMLTECILLSAAGALLGVLFAHWGAALLVRFISTAHEKVFLDLSLDTRVMAFTAGVAILTGLLFGVLPAFRSTRVSLASAMKGGQGDETEGRVRFRPGRWIVASQVALSLVLLVSAGLFVRSFRNLLTVDTGFDRSNVLLVEMDLHNAHIAADQQSAYCDQILGRLQAIPGVLSVSQSVMTPISGTQWNNDVTVDGPNAPTGDDALVFMNYVTPGYLATMRSPLLAGRNFDEHDTSASPHITIINETMARRFFGSASPIGKYFRVPEYTPNKPPSVSAPIQIVGVMRDAKYASMREDVLAQAFFPIKQMSEDGPAVFEHPNFELRTAMQPTLLAGAVQDALAGMNKSISLQFNTFAQQVDDSLTKERLLATLSGFFGGLALLLAMIGLYGVLAYIVTQRQKEIGIRMALGAEASSILRLVFKDVAILLLAGIPAGLVIAAFCSRFVQKMLFNLPPRDVVTMAFSAGVLICVAFVAAYFPARRASHTDPMGVLRQE